MADVTFTVTGLSSTASIGGLPFSGNEEGWGRLAWSQADWGDANTIQQGWGRLSWGSEAYGDSPTVTLSGLSATSSVGAPTVEVRPGWGTLDWGENGWGSVEEGIENLIGIQATSSVGAIIPADVVGISGVSATSSVGTGITFVISPTVIPDGQEATTSEGQLSINDGADHVQGLATLVATTAVGSITPADVIGISGVSATATVGPDVVVTDAQVFTIGSGGVGTTSIGSVITEVEYILSGQSATSGVGSISPADVVGLTGQSATISVGDPAALGYADVDITGNTSYSDVNKTNSASYSDVDVTGETSYTDVTHAA